jgi:hypothetical protein
VTSSSDATQTVSDGGWIQCTAYAGCVAENGTITASGIPYDDSVPQVGLGTELNPFAHFGDYIEVSYGDKVVKAQIVDYGFFGSGILLNPGVFEQFGVGSTYDWGVRTVSYQFV